MYLKTLPMSSGFANHAKKRVERLFSADFRLSCSSLPRKLPASGSEATERKRLDEENHFSEPYLPVDPGGMQQRRTGCHTTDISVLANRSMQVRSFDLDLIRIFTNYNLSL